MASIYEVVTSIYLIRAGKTDNYKIGISNNIENRLASLQTSHYERLSILNIVEFDTRFIALVVEEQLHLEYKRFNTLGEWFKFSNEQVSKVRESFSQELSETILLKAKVKELESKLLEEKQKPMTIIDKREKRSRDFTARMIIDLLWSNGKVKANNKLKPKTKIINIEARGEVEALSSVYKILVKNGYAELRGNKGYFALVDLDIALQVVQNGK